MESVTNGLDNLFRPPAKSGPRRPHPWRLVIPDKETKAIFLLALILMASTAAVVPAHPCRTPPRLEDAEVGQADFIAPSLSAGW